MNLKLKYLKMDRKNHRFYNLVKILINFNFKDDISIQSEE